MPSVLPSTSMILNGIGMAASALVGFGVTPVQVPQGSGWMPWASLLLAGLNLYLHGASAPVKGPLVTADPAAGDKKS